MYSVNKHNIRIIVACSVVFSCLVIGSYICRGTQPSKENYSHDKRAMLLDYRAMHRESIYEGSVTTDDVYFDVVGGRYEHAITVARERLLEYGDGSTTWRKGPYEVDYSALAKKHLGGVVDYRMLLAHYATALELNKEYDEAERIYVALYGPGEESTWARIRFRHAQGEKIFLSTCSVIEKFYDLYPEDAERVTEKLADII
ncbi:MAG: hypothetical protein HUJ93_03240, partial [Bacteroidales bacterium]|nr:hypothetical protein [Bacteroidales bacterium]